MNQELKLYPQKSALVRIEPKINKVDVCLVSDEDLSANEQRFFGEDRIVSAKKPASILQAKTPPTALLLSSRLI